MNVRERRKEQAKSEAAELIGLYGESSVARALDVHDLTVRRWYRGEVVAPQDHHFVAFEQFIDIAGVVLAADRQQDAGAGQRLQRALEVGEGVSGIVATDPDRELVLPVVKEVRKGVRNARGEPALDEGRVQP